VDPSSEPDPEPGLLGAQLDFRSLRYFVAVAEELHFTRAAARLLVAQQALSRDIRSLERQLGTQLLVRTTRRVGLTPEGERFLGRARELLALHDLTLREIREPTRPIVVDLLSEGRLTGSRVLELARSSEPDIEFRGRHGGGMGVAIGALLGGELDVAFGRADWLDQHVSAELERRLVRFEPLALLLPKAHPLAAQAEVPVSALRGTEIDANPGHANALEWSDLVRQFLALSDARPTPPHVAAIGLDEQAHHLVRQGLPILTSVDHVEVPGGVVRPLIDPVPIYPWSIVHRAGERASGILALRTAAAWTAAEERWLDLPRHAWLPQPESTRLERSELTTVADKGPA
jgi:DNA-binding transcriptional LysR family regulator